tara:strand:- start:91 stop:963 length:873 start_codon:yes stop_codon:yes gene_type:complete
MTSDQFGFNAFWWETLSTKAEIVAVTEELAGMGYRYIEWKDTSFAPDLARGLRLAVDAGRDAGLRVSNLVMLRDPAGDDADRAVADLKAAIDAAADCEIGILNTNTGWPPPPGAADGEQWWMPPAPKTGLAWDRLFTSMEAILKHAEARGVVIAIESVVGSMCHDFHSTETLLRRFQSDALALTFDPSHFFLSRDDIPWIIRHWGALIRHVHVKDAVGSPGVPGRDFLFPLLGEGGIDFSSMFAALEDIGYAGALSCEFESFRYMHDVLQNDYAAAARMTMDTLQKIWKT